MPTVPYSPVPGVAPSTQATPQVSVDTPISAFGGTIAAAIGSVGREVEGVGKEIFERAKAFQQLENESMAKEADAKYIQRAGELHARYNSLRGQEAVREYPRYVRQLDILRRDYHDALPNDMARRSFDASARQTMARTVFNAAGHAATEQRRWAIEASEAEEEAINTTAQQDPNGEVTSNEWRRTRVESIVRSRQTLQGWSDKRTDNEVQRALSRNLRLRIDGLARTEPFRAKELLDAERHNLHPQDFAHVEQVVQTGMVTAGSRRVSEEVNPFPTEGDPGPPLREWLETARRRAQEIMPDNANFAAAVQDRVRVDYDHQRSILRNDQINRDAVLIGAINGQYTNGRQLTTVEELVASSPLASGAWDNTTEPRRRQLMQMLAQNARGENRFTQDGLRRYQELRGLAYDDPAAFLNVDITGEKGMPNSVLQGLINQQQRVRQAPDTNPQVRTALGYMGSMLEVEGITRQRDPQRYLRFVGSLQDALIQYQRENNRQPRNPEEYRAIGSRLIQGQDNPNTGWNFGVRGWGWPVGPGRTPLFEQGVPPDLMQKWRADPRWEGRAPTAAEEEQFRLDWTRSEYQRLYGTKQKQKR